MPTGYTEGVGSGKITEFKDFALICARAMGACIMQRDDEMCVPPKMDIPSDYHVKALQTAEKDLVKFQKLSLEKKKSLFVRDKQERRQDKFNYIKELNEQKERYLAMLTKVEKWQPPSAEHNNFKKFMIEQLTESMKFGCDATYWEDELKKIQELTFEKWLVDEEDFFKKDIEYHTEHHQKEIDMTNSRNAWKRQLFESLNSIK